MTSGYDGPSLVCDLPLGRPGLTVHNELALTGWAVSPRGIAGVAVQIGERHWNAGYGFDTPSIARRLPEAPGGDRAGYELRIDTSRWDAGPHHVTVAAFDVDGNRAAIDGVIDVLPFEPPPSTADDNRAALAAGGVALSLDELRSTSRAEIVENTLEVSGWAYAEDGIEAVVVTVDGHHQHEAVRPIVRPGLVRDYGPDVAAEAGFVSRLDRVQCPPGRRSILVVAIGRNGRAAGVEREITVPVGAAVAAEPAAAELRDATSPDPDEQVELQSDTGLHEALLHWQDRALLAEVDAAVSRTEADLARTQQERTTWSLRQLEARVTEIDALRTERDAARSDVAELRRRTASLEEDLARGAALIDQHERSLSWRVTRPLRSLKRVWLGARGR